MFTGIWHGAAWNFLFWGLYFAVLLIIEKKWLLKPLNKSRWLKHVYLLFLILISFVIFNAPDMHTAFRDIGMLFGVGGIPSVSAEAVYYLKSYGITILVAVIGCMPLIPMIKEKISVLADKSKSNVVNTVFWIMKPVLLIVLMILSTAYLVDGSFNPFLYFRF